MSHRYIPLTDKDKNVRNNWSKFNTELFGDIPKDILLNRDLNIDSAEAETSLLRRLNTIANKNITKRNTCEFLGAGVYDHYTCSSRRYDFVLNFILLIHLINLKFLKVNYKQF